MSSDPTWVPRDQQWEYMIVAVDDFAKYETVDELNALGEKGWALCSAIRTAEGPNAWFYFRRRKMFMVMPLFSAPMFSSQEYR